MLRLNQLGRLIKQEVIEEGIKEGRKQELLRTSTKLLTKKFGVLSEDIKGKIEKADITGLEIIVDDILNFNKLEEVNKYLK